MVKMIKIIKIKKYIINLMKNVFALEESTNRMINSQDVKKINNIKSIEEMILNNFIIAPYIVFFNLLYLFIYVLSYEIKTFYFLLESFFN